MQETDEQDRREKFAAWTRQRLDMVVDDVMQMGLFESNLLEARPAWSFPFALLICQVREQGESGRFALTISGDIPTDYLNSEAAATPREAARHFAMKWQLDAARKEEPDAALVERAESLFELINNDFLWK